MNVSLYTAASAMGSTERWQELIAENLTASSAPGFKKQDLTMAAAQAGLLPKDYSANGATPHFSIPKVTTSTNFSQGALRPTGINTDLAIEGSGFFEVRLADGTLAYTRDGEFHLSNQGQLVTKQGFAVLGDNGPVQFDTNLGGPLAETISIAPNGEIVQGTDVVGRLRLVEFQDPARLTQVPGGLFLAQAAGLQQVADPTSTVQQRFLESANSSPVSEMANLLTAMRSFETNQKVVQMQDERLGRVISELSPS